MAAAEPPDLPGEGTPAGRGNFAPLPPLQGRVSPVRATGGEDSSAVSDLAGHHPAAAGPNPAAASPHPPSPAGEAVASKGDGWGKRPRSVPLELARALRKRLTPQEARLWLRLKELKPQGLHFRKQVPIDRYVVDFACLSRKLVVEIDGEQHGHETGRARDGIRDARLAELGFRVVRFGNHEVNRQLPMVLDTIFARAMDTTLGSIEPTPALASRPNPHPAAASPRPPSPAGEGREPVPGSEAKNQAPQPIASAQAGPAAIPSPAGEGVARNGDLWGPDRADP